MPQYFSAFDNENSERFPSEAIIAKRKRHRLSSLKLRLVLSHITVALVSLVVTGALVSVLAPRFLRYASRPRPWGHSGRSSFPGHGGGRTRVPEFGVPNGGEIGRGDGQGVGPHIFSAVEESLLWGLLAGLLTAVIVGAIIAHSIASSITSLQKVTQQLARGDYDAPMPPVTTTELAELSADIHTMARGLADTEKRRTRLIGEVSHEMRTPLTVIDGQVEAMVDGVVPLSPQNLEIITDESRRLRRLAEDLSALSRAEEGRVSLDIQRVDIRDIVRKVVERLSPQAVDAGLELQCQAGERTLLVDVDEDRIAQIITNLIGNALRATEPGGHIEVHCMRNNGKVLVQVQDDGEGLSETEVPKIFERFYRVQGRRSVGNETGSGIGLTISRQLALQHGGALTAYSAGRGRGATFTLELPAP